MPGDSRIERQSPARELIFVMMRISSAVVVAVFLILVVIPEWQRHRLLKRIYESDDAAEKLNAARDLARLGRPAVPDIVDALRSNDPWVILGAVEAVEKLGPTAVDAVPTLIELVQRNGYEIRWGAEGALGAIGPSAKAAIPALIAEVRFGKGDMNQEFARMALEKIDPRALVEAEAGTPEDVPRAE